MRGLKLNEAALAALSPEERERVLQEFRAVEAAFEKNPLWGYRPHARQVEFHEPMANSEWPAMRCFFGGNRSGKTTGAMVDTIVQCLDRTDVPEHLLPYKRWEPPFKCRIITPDFGDTHEVVLEKIREWCPREALKGNGWQRAYDKLKKVLWFKNGSRMHFNSNVQDRDQLGGSDLHRIVYDEEPRQDLRTESLTRLIDHDGEEIFAMTPLEGMSWLFDEVYEPWERGDLKEPDARVLVVDMDDNPHLSESGKARALAAYPENERESRKTGRFISFSGLIYPMFATSRHVVPAISAVPAGVEVFRAIDPGYRHLCAVLYGYLTVDDEMVIFDEIALPQATIKEVCDEIKRRDLEWGPERDGQRVRLVPRWTVIDPASRNKNSQTGRSDQAEFSDHGVSTIPGQNEVGPGINRVKERLNADRLKITANCVVLRGEFKRYRWTKDSKRSEDKARDRPVKKDDHLLDALRYLVAQRPLVPESEQPKETLTMKDRLLREAMKHFDKFKAPAHPSGAGMFQ